MAQNAGAQAVAPWIWAAPALYGMENSACGADGQTSQPTADIAKPFCSHLYPTEQRVAIGKAFAAATARYFPQVEASFGGHLPADATASQRLRGTLVASLRLTRANMAFVPKPGSVDAYMPLTLTMDITNIANGEVVFTRTATVVPQGVFSPTDVETQLAKQLPEHLNQLIDKLVSSAAQDFRPYAQSATVIGDVSVPRGRGYVVDKGRNAGLRQGDNMGDGHVLHAGADYAVVESDLGPLHNGQELKRTALAPVETLARPSLLVGVGSVPDGYAPDYVGQVFQDALGAAGRFAPVPVNPAFVSLRKLALSEAGSQIQLESRNLPDYAALLRVVLLPDIRVPTSLPSVTVTRYEAYAYGTLVDASGRVVGAWQGHEKIEDQVSGGIEFAPATRRDVTMRNALTDLARKMAAFHPTAMTAAISSQSQRLTIADPTGAVPLDLTLPVLREAGRFRGLTAPVMVPVGEVTGKEASASTVIAVDAGITPLSLHGGEVVALESAGNSANTREVFAQCEEAGQLKFEDRGAVSLPLWRAAAANLLATKAKTPMRLAELPPVLKRFAPSFAGWAQFRAAQARSAQTCILPVTVINPNANGNYDLIVGYTLHRDGAKIGVSGISSTVTLPQMPANTTSDNRLASLQITLSNTVQSMALQAAAALEIKH